jgi:guanylate kinase
MPEIEFSVSLTTRKPRGTEIDGTDYHFVSEDEFIRRRDADELAEWAQVFDARYGTLRSPLDDAIQSGRDILLDIDIQGAAQIRAKYQNDSVGVFVLPPTFEDLAQRLRKRGTDTEDAIERRLHRSREEARTYIQYDYLIINDDVDASVERFRSIVIAERSRVARLRESFAPWKS